MLISYEAKTKWWCLFRSLGQAPRKYNGIWSQFEMVAKLCNCNLLRTYNSCHLPSSDNVGYNASMTLSIFPPVDCAKLNISRYSFVVRRSIFHANIWWRYEIFMSFRVLFFLVNVTRKTFLWSSWFSSAGLQKVCSWLLFSFPTLQPHE